MAKQLSSFEFHQLIEEFEAAVTKQAEVNIAGQPAAIRRMAATEVKRIKTALHAQISSYY